ncbi:MAG TPA: dioxygenase [Bryobacteraceae bacterium]|nr:dioxygenase [Bryobacteraceae bacterium]
MKKLDPNNLTDEVISRLSQCKNPRQKQVLTSLIRHMHAFVNEVKLTPEEWMEGIQFLTACGHITTDKRQEFILLSDTHGVSALVDLIAHENDPQNATEASLLGPFYVDGAPERELGDTIASDTSSGEILVRGRVLNQDGKPIAGALLDTWHSSTTGFYDIQEPTQPLDRRGKFRTDKNGHFEFRTTRPLYYPIPVDGPVGKLVLGSGRHPYRPAHVHFIITAPGYERLVTALYVKGDQYLDSDVVFGSRESLVIDYKKNEQPGGPDVLEWDFVLAAARSRIASA